MREQDIRRHDLAADGTFPVGICPRKDGMLLYGQVDFQYLSHIAVQFRHRHLVSERLQVKFKLLSQFYHIYTELHSGFCVKS